jgi:protein-disulfide isomerase
VQARRDNTTLIVVVGVVAVVVVVLLVLLNVNLTPQPSGPPISSAGKTWGKADAPVTIDMWSDFQWPTCGHYAAALQQLAPKYIDTGKAKVVYHHFEFIGQESQLAGEASDCAAEQNKFWPFALYVLSHQAGENQGAFSRDNLKGFAKQVGLDTAAFNACFDSGKYTQSVKQETAEGERLGVQATPTFYVNGKVLSALPSPDQFGQIIDSQQK